MDFDNPSTWPSPELHTPPEFDLGAYQLRIDEIFGLSETNWPIVRLVWAADIKRCYSKFYTSWTNAGFGVDTELRAKYKYSSIKIPKTPDIIDIPPPRWIFEQFEHPGQYMASWEAARFNADGREVRPAPPPHGYYSHLMTVAKHDAKCCEDAKKEKVVCWGKFRHPDEKDLEILRNAKAKRDRDIEIDTTKPLTELDHKRIAFETQMRVAEQEADTQAAIKEFVDENALELLEQVLGRKFSEKTKKFAFPKHLAHNKNTKTEAGIIVPYNN